MREPAVDVRDLTNHEPAPAKLRHLAGIAAFTAALVATNLTMLGASRHAIFSSALMAFTATFAASVMIADRTRPA